MKGKINEFEIFIPEIPYDNGNTVVEANADRACKEYTSDEALIECINRCGCVDLRFMSEISGLSIETLISDLGGKAIFQDPEVFRNKRTWSMEEGWILAPRYLCGNFVEKLSLAKHMNSRFNGCFKNNVEAIKRLMPAKLSLEDIHVSFGAPWVPAWVYADFMRDYLRLSKRPVVYYNKEQSVWKIEDKGAFRDSVANVYTYGTMYMPALYIMEQSMNARTPKVFDYDYYRNGYPFDKILNKSKTLEVQEKQKKILRAFDEWIFKDETRKAKLQEAYNDTFVGYTFSPYDGSFLRFPGLNPNINLFKHQRDAIARILLSSSNVLLAHNVGTGKTYSMVVAAHELKRMGLSNKNMIVVPNNIIKDAVQAHMDLYPDDNILAVYPKDFTPAKRNDVLNKIKDNDYVCIYITYASFDMITMSKSYKIQKMQDEIKELTEAAGACSHKDEKRMLELEAEAQKKKLSQFVTKTKDTKWLPFEQLGITTLFVDEAHNYKNISIESRADNIVGMHGEGSKKCKEMLEKTQNVDRLIFSTGTCLTNSIADLFVLQSYLQPEELKFNGIDKFDMWINTFGERETNFEIDVDAGSLRPVTRFSSFHNLSELMGMFSTVCDFYQPEAGDENLPEFNGYENISVAKNKPQSEYIKYLSQRTDAIRSHQVSRKEDNLLKVTTDGRKCALDIRLVDTNEPGINYSYSDVVNNKLSACAKKILELYRKYPDTCQVVFSDIGTPKPGFNVYDSLKSILVYMGIPEEEIAFAHDAKTETARSKLFSGLNKGKIRVAIGSTQKLGVGVNIQEKLVALHHLSVPWRPADMVQREGRIIRRGNTCKEVFIYRYITEGSFDSYSWQLLENKQRFISSFLSGVSCSRNQNDIADTVLSYSEVKALAIGNPLIKKRVETANILERVRISNRQRQKQLIDLREVIDHTPEKIKRTEELRKKTILDAKFYEKNKKSIRVEERQEFGEKLLDALRDYCFRATEHHFGQYQGFDVIIPANLPRENQYIYVARNGGGRYYVEMDGEKVLGCAMRIDRLLDGLQNRVKSLKKKIDDIKKQKNEAEYDLFSGNPYQKQVENLEAELERIDKKLEESGGKAS